jgi:hypothetical protein
MGKHHRKWFIDEPIASNKRAEEMMDDLEDWGEEENKRPEPFRPEHLKRMGVTMMEGEDE